MRGSKICCKCTLHQCLHQCASNKTGCVGVDYDFPNEACYYHDTESLCKHQGFKAGVCQIRRTSCIHGKFNIRLFAYLHIVTLAQEGVKTSSALAQ